MATKKYGYNQYKPDGPAGMDIVDQELNRYSPAFDYLSGFVTRSKLKQVDDDRTGTSKPDPIKPDPTKPDPTKPDPTKPDPIKDKPIKDDPKKDDPKKDDPIKDKPIGPDPDPRFSKDFKTEQDAKDFLKNKYQTLLGRDPDEEGEKYFLDNFVSGQDRAADIDKIITGGKEFKARDNVVQTYNQMEGRNPTEQELDSIVNPGGALSTTDTTAGSEFLADYSAKLAAADDDTKKAETLSAAVSSKDDITDIDEKRKYTSLGTDKAEGGFSAKDIYSRGLNVGDLTTANIDKITQAYQSNFGRAPDKEGFNYWAKQLAATPDYDLDKAFKASAEYKIRNPGT